LTWTNTLTYSGTFWKNNSIKVLAATESISNYNRELGGSRQNLFSNDPNYRFLSQVVQLVKTITVLQVSPI
jgi:hypothetical protein